MLLLLTIVVGARLSLAASSCRSQPGDASFPTQAQWDDLNAQVEGRLVPVVPSAKACQQLGCTEAQWASGLFRVEIPGAMNSYNWEQDYTANPPATCLHNGQTCAQGNVPVFAVNATTAAHIQVGVAFAAEHNLRVAIKASGHDYQARSTAKGSLLLWTQHLRSITFTDSFKVGGKDLGSAVTVGSGVGLKAVYAASKAQGKIIIGGNAATVAPAGGFTQGAGHSAFSPIYGLAADNVFEYQIVTADGKLITANEISHPDLFWALRGGGAGSWGVIVSATFRTYPTFQVTLHNVTVTTHSSKLTGSVMAAHAEHIFDLDAVHAGQYFYLTNDGQTSTFLVQTPFTNLTGDQARAQMAPFLKAAADLGAEVTNESTVTATANDIVGFPDDIGGNNLILGSRLIPTSVYRNAPASVGAAYKTLVDNGAQVLLGHLVAGGKVSENANIDSAVHPKWRTAKTHVVVTQRWDDSASPADIEALKQKLTNVHVPVLARLTGESDSGSYSNEADQREPDFKTTFYGPNYARLESVKATYDPNDLFIVSGGVGSDRWDAEGLCKV